MAGASQEIRSSLATYQSTVAYDGTDFEGFQRQRKGSRTVQAVLEAALRGIGWQDRAIMGAGRTDSGVHAAGQVVAYRLGWEHTTEDLTAALNANLPADVAVRSTSKTVEGFHPRFDALSRRYRYRLFIDKIRDPLRERYAWRLERSLDMELLKAAAQLFEGEHDFAAFGRPPHTQSSTVRVVNECVWIEDGAELALLIEASAFLYHMVRHITAAMVDVGIGREEFSGLEKMLENGSPQRQGRLAPAAGLCLVRVNYPTNDLVLE